MPLHACAYTILLTLLGVASTAVGAVESGATPAGYHVIARYEIGGAESGYDYLHVDTASRRLFVAHGTKIEVLDVDSGARLGQLEGLRGVHGVEIVKSPLQAFATNGLDRTVTVFDPVTLQAARTIKYAGVKPDSLQYDAASDKLFVVNGGATGDLTVIDPHTGAIVATVDLAGGKLEQIAFDGSGRGFVNDEEKNAVHVFNTRTLAVIGEWPLSPGEGPTALGIDRIHHRLFSACGNNLMVVVDVDSGRVLDSSPIGADPDGLIFDSASGNIFTSNRDSTLSVLHEKSPGHYAVVQTVKTESGARTIGFDEKTGHIFLPAAKFGPTPAATKEVPEPRAPMVPASFAIVVLGR
jgi:DNA-binding beta-propeller fold protein YncE